MEQLLKILEDNARLPIEDIATMPVSYTHLAALKDTEATLDEVQRQLGAAQQARQLAAQLAAKQAELTAALPVLEAARCV